MERQRLEDQEKQRALERQRLEVERDRMENEKAVQLEIEKLRLRDREEERAARAKENSKFVASREIRLVPTFEEKNEQQYFEQFEKVALSLGWPKENWAILLQSVIKGNAQVAYTALAIEKSGDYDEVKRAILQAYELCPEAYRQKFRNLKKSDSQTFADFACEKENVFVRWCASEKVEEDYAKLRDLILVEEFCRCVGNEVKSYLNEKGASSIKVAARLTDEYSLIHRSKFYSHEKSRQFKHGGKFDKGKKK